MGKEHGSKGHKRIAINVQETFKKFKMINTYCCWMWRAENTLIQCQSVNEYLWPCLRRSIKMFMSFDFIYSHVEATKKMAKDESKAWMFNYSYTPQSAIYTVIN